MHLTGEPPAPWGYALVKYANGTFWVPRALVLARWQNRSPIGAPHHDEAEVWCPYCGEHHYHGWGSGTRCAHCTKGPFRSHDYFLDEPHDVPLRPLR